MFVRATSFIFLVGVLMLTSCSGREAEQGNVGVIDQLEARNQQVMRVRELYDTPLGAMPQVQHPVPGSDPVSVTDAYVVGSVVRVEPGESHWWPDIDEEITEGLGRHTVEYNADKADVSTVHVTLRIDRSIVAPSQPADVRGQLRAGREVTFGLVFDAPADPEAYEAELKAGGQLAVLLVRSSPVFDYDPNIWAVLEDGALMGFVQDDVVEFPAFEIEGSPTYRVADLEAVPDGG